MPPSQYPQKPKENKGFPLNIPQKDAAQAPISPLLIVAGAGTGKTRTLTSRILYLIEQGIPGEKICAITFTNKAAKEMADRIAATYHLDPRGRHSPLIGTFHSFGARILRRECRVLGRDPNFAIFDDHDSFDIIKKVVKALIPKRSKDDTDAKRSKKESPAFFAQKISEIKNLGTALEDARTSPEERNLVSTVFERYEEGLKRNNAFDFDDLIGKPVELFEKHPEILKKYQMMFDAILVDEYQDINPKQYELIKFLAGEHKNLSVVGDDEQTIYSWRYADIKTFLNFDKEWPKAKVHFLEENYRSTGNIINAASAVVQNNRFRTPKKLWTKNQDGEKITLYEAWGENDEAEWIAAEIEKLRAQDAKAGAAVLYRTNAQSRAIEQALIRRSIPYQIFGGLKFYERREVKDAVAALRWASNTKDEIAKDRLEKNLSKRKFVEFTNKISGAKDIKPLDVIKIFIETFGYFDYLEENFLNADEREENIGELINFASGFESLSELLERLSLLQSTDDEQEKGGEGRTNKEKEAVNKVGLLTIHLAKGLEFDSVFIAGASEGLLPHIRSIDNEAALEEERRLMYVAMTRARKRLYISFFGLPSRFVGEIPKEYTTLTVTAQNDDDTDDGEKKYDGNTRDRSAWEEDSIEIE